jgi:uncharacterized membrane protein
MEWIVQFFGRFHPLVVHLPIGILFLAFLFECLSSFERFKSLASAVQATLLIGSVFAIAAVVTGLFLSGEGGYDDTVLQRHQNFGVATAAFAVMLYLFGLKSMSFFRSEKKVKNARIILSMIMVTLLSVTGHLGGSMTHGEEYLFEPLIANQVSDPITKVKAIANTDDAILYRDVIEPILSSKCYSCHSSKKKKGDLRLDGIEFISQGGKHGAIIEGNIPDSSNLYRRLMLPMDDEDHMPPNESSQLSSVEIALIKTWIEEGSSFDKKIQSFAQSKKIKNYISSLLTQLDQVSLIPAEEVSAADSEALKKLKDKGVLILPLGNETNYLSVSFVNARSVTDTDLQLLLPLTKQLLWLNLARTNITDEGAKTIAQLSSLRQLHVNYTKIGDDGVKYFTTLPELNYLNLVGTKLTDKGLSYLSGMKKMKDIFVYQTAVTAKGLSDFTTKLPDTHVDTGGYLLPQLASDTIVFKRKI